MEISMVRNSVLTPLGSVPVNFYEFPLIQFFASLIDRIKNGSSALVTPETILAASKNNKVMVMLADDDSDDRELFEEIVTKINSKICVTTVEDGIQLMKVLSMDDSPLPDIIFLDLNMPGKSGKECLKEIKNNERLKYLPVVIFSTSAHSRDIMDTHRIGANLYIRKPNSINGLVSAIKKVFLFDYETLKLNPPINSYILSTDAL